MMTPVDSHTARLLTRSSKKMVTLRADRKSPADGHADSNWTCFAVDTPETNALIPRQRPSGSLTRSALGRWLGTNLFYFGPGPVMRGILTFRCVGLALLIALLHTASASYAQNLPGLNQSVSDLVDRAEELADEMNDAGCVDESTYRAYVKSASELAGELTLANSQLEDPVAKFQIRGAFDDLTDALQDLKKCPVNGLTIRPPQGPAPPVMTLDTECKACQTIADEIAAVDAKIGKLERSQESLRKRANPKDANVQRALGEDDAKIAALKAQRAKLEEQKAACEAQCKPKQTGYLGGGYLGGELAKNWGRVRSTESLATTDVVTNRFTDSGDPLGIGIVGGYNFKPWNNNIIIGPFASFDYLNQTINHNFAGGQFLGTTTHWFINAGLKAGFVTAPGLYLYGVAGAAFLNHDLNVNFATAAQSNTTTPGFTAGLGGEYQPSSWQLAGHPVSVFAQYQHTWWNNANFNMPTSSPAFNYAFRREDDTIKLGVNFYFGAAQATPAPAAYPVKALPPK
jgi:hypothetical protein